MRRMLRFGQTQPVEVDVITTEGGSRSLANLQRKAEQADRMLTLVAHMNHAQRDRRSPQLQLTDRGATKWLASQLKTSPTAGDIQRRPHRRVGRDTRCVDPCRIYSPPFTGPVPVQLERPRPSNARDYQEFWEHYGFIIREKFRRHDAGSALAFTPPRSRPATRAAGAMGWSTSRAM